MDKVNTTTAPLSALEHLQQRFCLLNLSGEIRIVDKDQVTQILAGVKSGDISFFKKSDGEVLMRRVLENLPVHCEPKTTIANFWINPKTHVYTEIAFSPRVTPASTLNYWSGPTTLGQQGDWSFIKEFLLNVICGRNLDIFNYLIFYLAHMLQKPAEKPGVMLVMLGSQGTGKGTVFALLRKIWSRTALQVSDVDAVIGRFNAALERNFVICMDEALFSGDKKSLERLKSLITEPVCQIEQKYQPSRSIESVHRFFAASNNDHFAHVDRDDRRFLFLRVSSERQGQSEYFKKLHQQIEDSGTVRAMVYDLMNLNLNEFNIRVRPKTKEHLKQKLQSLAGFERYWFEVLTVGSLDVVSCPSYAVWTEPRFVKTVDLLDHFKRFDRNADRYNAVQSQQVAASLAKLCPSAISDRIKTNNTGQVRGYQLPSLEVARREFDFVIGGKVDWGVAEAQEMGQADWEMQALWETYYLDDEINVT